MKKALGNEAGGFRSRGIGAPEREEEVILALGSNLGDRLEHLRRGVVRLAEFVRVVALSPVVESRPQGVEDGERQRDYLNAVVRGRTALDPEALLEACLEVERAEGRVREEGRSGRPRTLDVDILFFGQRIVKRAGLEIPHHRWAERGFVLVPLRAVAGGWRDPVTGRTVEEVCATEASRFAGVREVHGPEALGDLETFHPADAPELGGRRVR